jgi:glycerol-3-phosphate acyltransferase PlsY
MENMLIAGILSYLLGSIPNGLWLGKAVWHTDLREHGSHNIGATNAWRTLGKPAGISIFLLDFAKGAVSVYLGSLLVGTPVFMIVCGILAIVGHSCSLFLKFKGGKGVATAFGMLVALVPGLVGVAFLVFVAAFALSNYISLGSCLAAAFLAVGVWFPWLGARGVADLPQCILVTAIAVFVIWKHRANISRLLSGTENKIYIFGRGGKTAG